MENKYGQPSQLHLTAARRDGRTIPEDVFFTAPFKVMHPFYEKEDLMTIMLLTASAGILTGDRQEFFLHVKEGAAMEFVSQSYEKIHRMQEGYAERKTLLRVDAGARLLFTPLPVIPFAGSDFRSTVDIELADETARLVYRDVLTAGRAAHGERFGYRRFQNRICVRRQGRMIFRDNTCFVPGAADVSGFGMYEGFTHLGSLIFCGEELPEEWMRRVREMMDAETDMEGGVTRAANDVTVVRILGMSGQRVGEIMEEIQNIQKR